MYSILSIELHIKGLIIPPDNDRAYENFSPPPPVGLTFLYDRDGGFILHKNLVALFVCLFLETVSTCSFCFLEHTLWKSLYRPSWPRTHRGAPASVS